MYNTKSDSNVNYGLWVIMMCQCRFINCNKCTTLVEDTDDRGGYAHVGAVGNIGNLCIFPAILL